MSVLLHAMELESVLDKFIVKNVIKFNTNTFKITYDVAHESMMITIIKGDED